ncbi:M56 family metallopeptidase [Clostridioides difficile]|uniref:M56 family metallopeptidase n=2 Tax=Clostridioides difficile TaxID=1496 RepID=UPI0021C5A119|nr:M56 family metallopeptidase [Clostridioides difficile]UUV14925.1 M56 family metallopeptidase [Clostridioides difficile]
MSNFILNGIFRTVIVSSLSILLILIFKKNVFKRFSKKFNYYIWMIVVIKLFLPFTYYTFTINILRSKKHININNINLEGFNNVSTISNNIILYTWIITVVVYLIYTIFKYIKLKNLINDLSYDVDDEEIVNLYKNILEEFNIKKDIKLKYSYEVETPAFFNSCVLLPTHEYKLKELDWIFRHELMHFKSRDLYLKYVILFLKTVYWFNPFIYIMDKHIDLDCELYCDERVLKNRNSEEKKDYALTILNAMRKGSNTSNKFIAGLHKQSDIKKRVMNMFNEKYKNGILMALTLCLLSSITFLKVNSTSIVNLNVLPKGFEDLRTVSSIRFSVIGFTYADAPKNMREEYKINCESLGLIPKDSDKIEVGVEYYDSLSND